jgi:23S rRNA (cytidine1920-2'-O)/16S rRNA (cytidine1409-2'-O)-methyltransferase
MSARERLDKLLVQRGLAESREQAQRMIMAGWVLVEDRPATKPGHRVPVDATIRVKEQLPYVSRGGVKLAAALDAFGIEPKGWVCADIGASTGGFTDVLLQRGAARVYAIDVGYGQLHWRLRQDPRVVVMERTNARYLQRLPEPVHLVTIDASFISLRLLLPAAKRLLAPQGQIIALVKPQFEAGPERVGKGGVVRDPAVHRQVLTEVVAWAAAQDFGPQGLIPSPILGPKGNREFLLWLKPGAPPAATETLVAEALARLD